MIRPSLQLKTTHVF